MCTVENLTRDQGLDHDHELGGEFIRALTRPASQG
jgi:hypothetical protein